MGIKRIVAKTKKAFKSTFTDAGAARREMAKAVSGTRRAGKKSGVRASASAVTAAADRGMKKAKRNRIAAGVGGAGVTAGIGAGMYAKNKSKKKK